MLTFAVVRQDVILDPKRVTQNLVIHKIHNVVQNFSKFQDFNKWRLAWNVYFSTDSQLELSPIPDKRL